MSIQDMKTNDEILIEYLKADNKRLKDELQSVNDDYNNDHKVHNDYADGLLEEMGKLKADNKRLNEKMGIKIAKEYKAEAEEYFHHNPKAKEVYFYMITDYDMKDAERGDLMLNQDDAICSVINAERSN